MTLEMKKVNHRDLRFGSLMMEAQKEEKVVLKVEYLSILERTSKIN